MTLPNRQLFWIASLSQRRAAIPPARASAARSAAGHPAKKTSGLAPADTNGTPSIPEASALPASISGLRLSAFLVAAGRHIPIGTPIHEFKNRRTHEPDYRPYPNLFCWAFSLGH